MTQEQERAEPISVWQCDCGYAVRYREPPLHFQTPGCCGSLMREVLMLPASELEALEGRVRELIAAGELLDLAAVAFADVLRGFPVDAAYRKGIHNADDAHSRWLTALSAFNEQLGGE